jgi:hypothetical protein
MQSTWWKSKMFIQAWSLAHKATTAVATHLAVRNELEVGGQAATCHNCNSKPTHVQGVANYDSHPNAPLT